MSNYADRRAELVAAELGDDLSADERAELDTMIAADPTVAEEIEALRRVVHSLAGLRIADPAPTLVPSSSAPAPGRAVSGTAWPRAVRRASRVLVAASVGLLVGVGATLAVQSVSSPDPVTGPPGTLGAFESTTFTSTDDTRVRGGLVAHTWGTETVLDISGSDARTVYDVLLIDASGSSTPSGSFVGTGADIDCRMNAALDRADVRGIEIRTSDGRTVASAAVPTVG